MSKTPTLAPDTLRPSTLDKFIGQSKLKNVLEIAIRGAIARDEPVGHSLFVGSAGLGKTTLSVIIAEETQRPLITASATSVTRVGAMATLLNQIPESGAVLFIDEIHRLPRVVEESLYSVMEDYRLDITTEKMHINLRVPKFTLCGATTRMGALTKPLRDRFKATYHLAFYEQAEIEAIVKRSAGVYGLVIEDAAVTELARRAKRTPRIANNLLEQSRDFAFAHGIGNLVSYPVILGMMEVLEIDERGLNRVDRLILETMLDKFKGGPVGLETLAATMVEEPDVLERVYEPYLVQEHLIERTPRGRVVTAAGLAYMNRNDLSKDKSTVDFN